jgi:hypothetical protein
VTASPDFTADLRASADDGDGLPHGVQQSSLSLVWHGSSSLSGTSIPL